jgi:2-alkenal reductase
MRRALVFGPPLALLLAGLACVLPTVSAPTQPAALPTPQPATLPAAVPVAEAVGGLASDFALEANLVELYGRVNQGVVTIYSYSDLGPPHPEDLPSGQGSGFVIDDQGHIVTNQHVVQGADQLEVDFASGHKAWAEVLGTDPDSDLAVLEVSVPAEALVPLPLGDSSAVRVGDFVVAIGNPFGLSGSMTVGVVSAIGRVLESERQTPEGRPFSAGGLIQTDAAINPGNSGGPLLNLRGQVVGVNRAIRTEEFTVSGSAANSGVGFAVPVNILRRVVPALIEQGSYDYPYLGISSVDGGLNLVQLEALGLPADTTGAYVTCLVPGGPAEQAGLRGGSSCDDPQLQAGGDIVVAIDGQPVETFSDLLTYLITQAGVGDQVTLTVLREGQTVDVPVTLAPRP